MLSKEHSSWKAVLTSSPNSIRHPPIWVTPHFCKKILIPPSMIFQKSQPIKNWGFTLCHPFVYFSSYGKVTGSIPSVFDHTVSWGIIWWRVTKKKTKPGYKSVRYIGAGVSLVDKWYVSLVMPCITMYC